MARVLAWLIGGSLILGTGGVLLAVADEATGPAYVPGGQPVTAEQLRQKMQSDGYSNIQIAQEGRYFHASGTKAGAPSNLVIDSQTGKLDDDDDDD